MKVEVQVENHLILVMGHVWRVMDEGTDARDHQDHHGGQRVEQQAEGHPEASRLDPFELEVGLGEAQTLVVGQEGPQPQDRPHRKGEGRDHGGAGQDPRSPFLLVLLQPVAEEDEHGDPLQGRRMAQGRNRLSRLSWRTGQRSSLPFHH
jgi:hypothetical protein